MGVRITSVVVSLLIAGLPALAQNANRTGRTIAAHGTIHRATGRSLPAHGSAVPAAVAAMPDGEWLAVQSDLVWLGDYQGMSAEEFDGHTLDAIKAFQKRHNGKETGVLTPDERAVLAEVVRRPQAVVGWRLIEDSATGARLGLPEKLVPRASASRTGSRWTSGQGQIQIETFRLHEASLPALFEEEKRTSQRHVGFSALSPGSFVIAGEQRLKKFVVRAQASGDEVRGVTILYDQATEGTMAPVAVAVSDTFQGFPDANAGPLPARSRGVEYGTAIVASDRGHLVTLERTTERCQSITISGFGHAEHVAEDKTNGLALLRLYGAHNLVPTAVASDGSTDGQLTLFGFVDPLARTGDDSTVTKAIAHVTAQGLDPMPRPGFSGAPALDGQGRFVGLVEFKPSAVAAATTATAQATLIPAAAVGAFLQAQGIVPASAPTAIDRSVVRVICVRK
jgi:hypothetical protein